MIDVRNARRVAHDLLAIELPYRLTHVAGVAGRASETGVHLDLQVDLLVASAWLHDVGYAPSALDTGFHPLDGARYLRSQGFPETVCCLVAHHSNAEVEANLRGFGRELREEFSRPKQSLMDALCYCDMVTGPTGQSVSVAERLAEIRARYGPDHVVAQFIDLAEDDLVATVQRVELRLYSASAS